MDFRDGRHLAVHCFCHPQKVASDARVDPVDRHIFRSHWAYRGQEASANTDHVSVAADLAKKVDCPRRSYDVERLLQDSALQAQYSLSVNNKYSCLNELPDDVEGSWKAFCTTLRNLADEVLGPKQDYKSHCWAVRDTL